jgi:hypothetical protein
MATLNFEKMIKDSKTSLDQYYDGFDRVLTGQKKVGHDFTALQKKITDNIAIEHCGVMKVGLQTLRDAIEAVNDARDKAITSRMQNAVLDKLHESRSLTVTPIVDLLSVVKKDRDKWLNRKNSKKNDKKDVEERKHKYEEEAADLYESMGGFERMRTHELQNTLKEFCNSQLYFHCHAVESWTKALQKISDLDMEEWHSNVAANVLSIMNKENLSKISKGGQRRNFDDDEYD